MVGGPNASHLLSTQYRGTEMGDWSPDARPAVPRRHPPKRGWAGLGDSGEELTAPKISHTVQALPTLSRFRRATEEDGKMTISQRRIRMKTMKRQGVFP